eukprot:gnl/TRDRNA2_/TRDRNA2_192832_c0_seq1.p1 gnl/TRDRNA2_/TRDRNA2_192832_c0~~gnl/TRDRNA2_/TRDRNA2_192832_c0_seq1.p1  ORF type:complete len:314 (+),score=52.24 gnl/TRDRNA2_/TRDRNA2_192832_c0_seq1:92-943(+)
MVAVLAGLECFDAPALLTAREVAREFSASLDPALDSAGCAVEVYRLERVAPDVQLSPRDAVVCRVPTWHFDFQALEDLLHSNEDLRSEQEKLQTQNDRMQEALITLNGSIEAAEAAEIASRRAESNGTSRKELQQVRQQLAQSEKKQQETKATVMALRTEFMHLVDMMSDGAKNQNVDIKDLEASMRNCCSPQAPVSPHYAEMDKLGSSVGADAVKTSRYAPSSQQVAGTSTARRPMGSPRAYRSGPGAFTTPRPGARPRGVHQRSGHSAGASLRQRAVAEPM